MISCYPINFQPTLIKHRRKLITKAHTIRIMPNKLGIASYELCRFFMSLCMLLILLL